MGRQLPLALYFIFILLSNSVIAKQIASLYPKLVEEEHTDQTETVISDNPKSDGRSSWNAHSLFSISNYRKESDITEPSVIGCHQSNPLQVTTSCEPETSKVQSTASATPDQHVRSTDQVEEQPVTTTLGSEVHKSSSDPPTLDATRVEFDPTIDLPPLDDAAAGGIEQHQLPTFNEFHAMLSEGGTATANGGEQKANKGVDLPNRAGQPGIPDSKQAKVGDTPQSGSQHPPESSKESRSNSQANPDTKLPRGDGQSSVENESNGHSASNGAKSTTVPDFSSSTPRNGEAVHKSSGTAQVPSTIDADQLDAARSNEGTKPSTDTSSSAQPSSSRPITLRRNVAAVACGAKLLESSKAIKNPESILNGNNDEYLNVPCSAEKWFVIEVCEPVQLRVIEMANYELFSSRVKLFRVLVSDRYPAKTWDTIGVFTALDVKGLQTFDVASDKLIKYVKFELLEHYGSEHYCPISMIRLFGLVSDDLDDEEEDLSMHSVAHQLPPVGVPPKSLFDSVPVVDQASSPQEDTGSQQGHASTEPLSVSKPTDSAKGLKRDGSLSTGSTESPTSHRVGENIEETGRHSQHAPPSRAEQIRVKTHSDSFKRTQVLDEGDTRPNSFAKKKTVCNVDHPEQCELNADLDTNLLDQVTTTTTTTAAPPVHSSQTTPVPSERSKDSAHSSPTPLTFGHKTTQKSSTVAEPAGNIFTRLKHFVWDVFSSSPFQVPVRETTHVDYNLSAIQLCPHHLAAIDSLIAYGLLNTSVESPILAMSNRRRRGITALSTCLFELEHFVHPVTSVIGHTPVTVTHRILSIPRKDRTPAIQSCFEATQLLNLTFFNGYHRAELLNALEKRPVGEYNILQLFVAYQYRYQFNQHTTTSSALVSRSSFASCRNWWTLGRPSSQLSVLQKSMCPKLPEFLLTSDQHSKQHSGQPLPKVELSPLPVDTNRNSAHTRQPESSDTIVVPAGLSGSRKDTVLMRLSNRVRLLERNVSVSMRYLEELSQSYRHQMERLSKSFNLTNAWLKATAQGAQERDQLQQTRIDELELRLEELLTRIRHGALQSASNDSTGLLDETSALRNLQAKQNNTLNIEMSTPPLPNFDPPPDWNPSPSAYYGQWSHLDEDWGDEDAFVETEDDMPSHPARGAEQSSARNGPPRTTFPLGSSVPLCEYASHPYMSAHVEELDGWWHYIRSSISWDRWFTPFRGSMRWLLHLFATHSSLFGVISMACVHLIFAITSHLLIYLVWLRPHGRKLTEKPPVGSFSLVQSRSGEWFLVKTPTNKAISTSKASPKSEVMLGTASVRRNKSVSSPCIPNSLESKASSIKLSSPIPRQFHSAQNHVVRSAASSQGVGTSEYHEIASNKSTEKTAHTPSRLHSALPTVHSNGGLRTDGSSFYREKFVPLIYPKTLALPPPTVSQPSAIQPSGIACSAWSLSSSTNSSDKCGLLQLQHKSNTVSLLSSIPPASTQEAHAVSVQSLPTDEHVSSNSSTVSSKNARRRRNRKERAKAKLAPWSWQ